MFLQGLSDFATEIGIIDATGQIPGVRVQGNYTACPTVSTCACILQVADSMVHAYLLNQDYNRHAPRLTQDIAVHAEEWNSIAEGGPDFYTAHLMPPEPQPSLASMQQGQATSCLGTVHPQQLLDEQGSPQTLSSHATPHSSRPCTIMAAQLQLSSSTSHVCVPQSSHMWFVCM